MIVHLAKIIRPWGQAEGTLQNRASTATTIRLLTEIRDFLHTVLSSWRSFAILFSLLAITVLAVGVIQSVSNGAAITDRTINVNPTAEHSADLEQRHRELLRTIRDLQASKSIDAKPIRENNLSKIILVLVFLSTVLGFGGFIIIKLGEGSPVLKTVIGVGAVTGSLFGSFEILKVENFKLELGDIPPEELLRVIGVLSLGFVSLIIILKALEHIKIEQFFVRFLIIGLSLSALLFGLYMLVGFNRESPPPPAEISLKLASVDEHIQVDCREGEYFDFKVFPPGIARLDDPALQDSKSLKDFHLLLEKYLTELSREVEGDKNRIHTLILIGSADEQRPSKRSKYKTNAALAQARADWVREKLVKHLEKIGSPPAILTLYVGPTKIDENQRANPDHRSVRACALWSKKKSPLQADDISGSPPSR